MPETKHPDYDKHAKNWRNTLGPGAPADLIHEKVMAQIGHQEQARGETSRTANISPVPTPIVRMVKPDLSELVPHLKAIAAKEFAAPEVHFEPPQVHVEAPIVNAPAPDLAPLLVELKKISAKDSVVNVQSPSVTMKLEKTEKWLERIFWVLCVIALLVLCSIPAHCQFSKISTITVTDGSNTDFAASPFKISFSGCTVGGSGTAMTVTCSGSSLTGSQYQLFSFTGTNTGSGNSHITTDSNNDLNVAGGLALGASPPSTIIGSATGIWGCAEGSTAATPTPSQDSIRCDSTLHGFKLSLNNGSEFTSLMNYSTSANIPTMSVVNTVEDTSTPVTVSTTNFAEIHANQNSTAATAITYDLPTAAANKQFCFTNSYNGSAATTGTLELLTSAAGQLIIFTDGTVSASGGYVISGGAAADAACVVGLDSTHWQLYVERGTWSKH